MDTQHGDASAAGGCDVVVAPAVIDLLEPVSGPDRGRLVGAPRFRDAWGELSAAARSAGPVRRARGGEKSVRAWDHRPQHRFLLSDMPRHAWADAIDLDVLVGPDVIFVPTCKEPSMTVSGIDLAIELCQELRCRLIILRSGAASAGESSLEVPAALTGRVHVIDMELVDPLWWASTDVLARTPSGYDIAAKRNFAISLACAVGWGQLLFLDDDMKCDLRSDGLNARTVATASRWMRREDLRAVGWSCPEFPDNSVVCHARRLAGLPQSTFIGAGSLLIEVSAQTPHFPDAYNEDWFFLIALAASATDRFRVLGRAGTVVQLPYDPYVPRRVEREEEGDILAECLMNLLEDGSLADDDHSPALDVDFWRRAIRSRGKHVKAIRNTLLIFTACKLGRGRGRRDRAARALHHAQSLHCRISPESLADWVRDWFEHRDLWQEHLSRIEGCAAHEDVVRSIDFISRGAAPYDAGAGIPAIAPVGYAFPVRAGRIARYGRTIGRRVMSAGGKGRSSSGG